MMKEVYELKILHNLTLGIMQCDKHRRSESFIYLVLIIVLVDNYEFCFVSDELS